MTSVEMAPGIDLHNWTDDVFFDYNKHVAEAYHNIRNLQTRYIQTLELIYLINDCIMQCAKLTLFFLWFPINTFIFI